MKEGLVLRAQSILRRFSFHERCGRWTSALVVAFFCLGHAATASAQTWTNVWPVPQEVLVLAVDPVNVSNIYAGLVSDGGAYPYSGVFKSSDGGVSWYSSSVGLPPATGWPYRDVYALAIDPTTPSTIYAALFYWGVYKSIDSGNTWVAMNSGLPGPAQQNNWALAVDPQTPSTIYVGADNIGVYKSTDGGATWNAASNGLPANASIASIAIDPVTPSTIYLGAYGAASGVYKSTNGGASWSASGTGIAASTDIHIIRINPQTTSTLFAGIDDVAGVTTGGVYVSTNSGASWSLTSAPQPGDTVHGLAIDPVTVTTVYAAYWYGGVYRSTDGGNTWTSFDDGLTDFTDHSVVIALTNPLTVYVGTCNSGVFAVQIGQGPAFTVAVNPGYIAGGYSSTGTFALNNTSGGTATLTSSNTSVATVPASVTVNSGSSSATFTINTSAVTTLTAVAISATYNGTVRAVNVLVTPAISSVVLNPSSVVGGNTSTATVSLSGAAPPNAVVSLTSSNSAVASVPGTVTIPAGETSAEVTVSTSAVTTTHSPTITASYNGSSSYSTLTVTPPGVNGTTTTVTTAPNPSTFGQSVTLTATVTSSAGVPVGTVAFTDGATTLASGVAVNGSGQASFSTSALPAGSQTITASFTGTNGWQNSSGNSVPQVVQDGTVTTVASVPNPSSYWQSVTFTATITAANSGAGTPTGTVTFTEGATTLASAVVVNGSGHASFSTVTLAVGSHTITASFTGTNGWQNSGGIAAPQVVQGATATAAVSAPNPSSYGQSVTYMATITAATGYPGAGTPTGTVTFSQGATTLASAVPVNGSGQASFSTSALSVGSHTITASFTGTNDWQNSSGNAAPQAVQDATSTAVVSTPNPSPYGQSVTFTATITGGGTGAGTPTGTVTFSQGATTLASAVPVNGSGQATFSTTTLAVGSNIITASFTGTNGWQNSSGNAAPQVVQAVPLAITASSASMTYGGTVPTITPSYSGFVNGDTAASLTTPPTCSTTATGVSPAGSYPSSCTGAVDPNYAITYVGGAVLIGPAPLAITAPSMTLDTGSTFPTFTPTYSGFVLGQSAASLTTAPTCSTTATTSSPGGTYPITCAGAVDSNYAITYVPGTLTLVGAGAEGWWKLNEGGGSVAVDSSGNGNNGTWHGTPNGTSGYYSVGQQSDLGAV